MPPGSPDSEAQSHGGGQGTADHSRWVNWVRSAGARGFVPPAKRVADTEYDANRSPVKITKTAYSAGGASVTTLVTQSFNQYGDLLSQVDEQGTTTTYTYKPNFHQVTAATAVQSSTGAVTKTEFTVSATTGNVNAARQVHAENLVDKSIWTDYTYDAYGNRTQAKLKMAGRHLPHQGV